MVQFFFKTSTGENTGGGSEGDTSGSEGDNTGDSEGGTGGTDTGGSGDTSDDNSGFFNSILEFLETIANFCMYLNPFSEDFFGYKIIEGIIEGFTSFFVGDGTEENKGILGFLQSIFEGIANIVEFILNFFVNLLDFFIHLFVPTDEQWEEIKNSYSYLMTTIEGHIPFYSFIKSTFTDIQNTVINPHDFLLIEMPSFSFFGGHTEEVQYINVRDAYEPYRIKIRGWLTLIVYGLGFVYIAKSILNYSSTHSGDDTLKDIGKKGD